MVRFLDANKLSVLTKNDHVIYSRKLIQDKDFKEVKIIIQIGKEGMIKKEELVKPHIETTFQTHLRGILNNHVNSVYMDSELEKYVS